MEIHARETRQFDNLSELAFYQQREIRKLLDGTPATAPIKTIQFRYRDNEDVIDPDQPQTYGIIIEEEKTIDIDPFSNNKR